MKNKKDSELMSYIRSEIRNLDKAISRAYLENKLAKAAYYEELKDSLVSGMDRLLSENVEIK